MCNNCVAVLADNVTRTLQEVQNEKSEQQLEMWVFSCIDDMQHICVYYINRQAESAVQKQNYSSD